MLLVSTVISTVLIATCWSAVPFLEDRGFITIHPWPERTSRHLPTVIYTEIDGQFASEEMQRIVAILEAISRQHSTTCLRFEQNQQGNNRQHLLKFVKWNNGTCQHSNFGYNSALDYQEIYLSSQCSSIRMIYKFIFQEIGIIPEHLRYDRNNYIEINWNNIDPSKTGEYLYFSRVYPDIFAGSDYNFASITHAQGNEYKLMGLPYEARTLEARNNRANYFSFIAPNALDYDKISKLYCNAPISVLTTPTTTTTTTTRPNDPLSIVSNFNSYFF